MHITLSVGGEIFEVWKAGNRYDYKWLSGKNQGYGFTSILSMDIELTMDQMDESIRSFLSNVDPDTGYLRE